MKLQIKVIPCSSKNAIVGWLDNTLKVKVISPPEKGKANKTLIKLLEKSLALAKGSITITNGTAAFKKVIKINTEDEDDIIKKLDDISLLSR